MAQTKADILTEIMLLVFRVNGRLLEKGDRLVAGLNLTSARWQVLGAVALAGKPLTAPQIAASMGITRQGAQKQLNLLLEEGVLDRLPNPSHERSSLYALTERGGRLFSEATRLCDLWATDLGQGFSEEHLRIACQVLGELQIRLDRKLPTESAQGLECA